jgi:cobalt/nickel transport system permease protein
MIAASSLFAVHISDGVLSWSVQLIGFVLLTLALPVSLYRIDDRTIPRIGVLTAAFFVSSQIHIPFGPVSVHLILNSLVGVILRYRAPVAIVVGLVLQALLFSHGGWQTLGVNFLVLALPAVGVGYLFPKLHRWIKPAVSFDPAFGVGLVVGVLTATLTVLFHATVLWFGGSADLRAVAVTSLAAHIPVIVIEGLVVGFACRVLAKAKPEWLGVHKPNETEAPTTVSN